MTSDEQKSLDNLVKAIDQAYNSTWRMMWRGFLLGLARGLGATVGLAVVVWIGVYLLKQSGLGESFESLMHTLNEILKYIDSTQG